MNHEPPHFQELLEKIANRHDTDFDDVMEKYKEIALELNGAYSPLLITESKFREVMRKVNAYFARQ